MNALAHAAEALYGPGRNPVAGMAATAAAGDIAAGLEERDLDARDRLARGSILAAYAMDSAGYSLHHVLCQTIVRMRDFGQERIADFSAKSLGVTLFAELVTLVHDLDNHAEAQTSNRSAAAQGTTTRKAARADLRAKVEAISRTARAMALNNPGLAKRFRMPRGNNDQSLVSTARAFLTDAEPLKDEFIRRELPASFLDDLAASIAAFEQAVADQNRSTGASVAATRDLAETIKRGLDIRRQLNPIVRNKYRTDPATLDAWEFASHIKDEPKAKKKAQAKPADAPQK